MRGEAMTDKRIFKASEVDSSKSGWICDLSGPDAVNPDPYWYSRWHFRTRQQAVDFARLVDNGTDPGYARNLVTEHDWD